MKKLISLISTVLAAAGCATAVEQEEPSLPPVDPKEESPLLSVWCGPSRETFNTNAVSIHFRENEYGFSVTPAGYQTRLHKGEDCSFSAYKYGEVAWEGLADLSITCDYKKDANTKVHFEDVAKKSGGVLASEFFFGRRLRYFPQSAPDTLVDLPLGPKEERFESKCTIQALSL